MKPWVLANNNYGYIKDQQYEVAVLPLGATEPHNLHLPYGTDVFEATIVGDKICEAAHEAGAKVILLPTIPFGTETNLREFPLAINLNPSTLNQVITDVVESLLNDGIRKVILLNSHGGNGLKPYLREMAGKNDAHLFLCNWYQSIEDVYFDIFEKREDHAGEMETSFGLAFFPELVAQNEDGSLPADDGATNPTQLEALNKGWVSITRPWHLLTKNSGAADPHAATAEKGRKMMDVLVERLGKFIVELSNQKITDQFPY
ncbi:MAG: creatininase family protein [Mariniblastus sp.]|nr:creatininase family protein [Mariniblastus sp.]